MIKERICSYKLSKLLQEKGFDEECDKWYIDEDLDVNKVNDCLAPQSNSDHYAEDFECSAPTHQMACDWLRKVHCIHINIFRYPAAFLYNNKQYKPWYFQYTLLKPVKEIDIDNNIMNDELEFDLYEEAVEAAIKYCLENLI